MQEKLISFETAKLAYQKQFQEHTQYFYTEENELCSIDTDGEILNIYNDDLTFKDSIWDCNGDFWYRGEDEEFEFYNPIKYSAPTQSLLQKELREKHEIIISVIFELDSYEILIDHKYNTGSFSVGDVYKTYEEALEIGLQEALKLI